MILSPEYMAAKLWRPIDTFFVLFSLGWLFLIFVKKSVKKLKKGGA